MWLNVENYKVINYIDNFTTVYRVAPIVQTFYRSAATIAISATLEYSLFCELDSHYGNELVCDT